jgi:hypothetical protein
LLAGCGEQPTSPTTPPEFAVWDGAHGGNPAFYFLPPLVPAPSYSGTFDGTQHPVVEICELAGTACGAPVASFSGSAVTVSLTEGTYSVKWKFTTAGLNPAKLYRIQVVLASQVLGYADLVVVDNGGHLKLVDKNRYEVPTVGGILQIKFRIERGAHSCPPGTPGCGWSAGDLTTYSLGEWGDATTAAGALLVNSFTTVYAATGSLLAGRTPSYYMTFDPAQAIFDYLPASGTPGPLDANLVNPTSSSSGSFGGEMVALTLNIDFSDHDLMPGTAGLHFGDLVICSWDPLFDGRTVRAMLGVANIDLGGAPFSLVEFNGLAQQLNASFTAGGVSAWAQRHLFAGACPVVWHNGEVVSYGQSDWGDDPATVPAAGLLVADFGYVYPFSIVEIGISGLAGFSAAFTSGPVIVNFLPQGGTPGTFTTDLLDPTSSSAGLLGGAVLALRLDLDFADAGFLPNSSGLVYGDLRVCDLPQTSLNGMTLRDLFSVVNTYVGGDISGGYSADVLFFISELASSAFVYGVPSAFAHHHIVAGPSCP